MPEDHGEPRQATTTPDQYVLSIEEAQQRYDHAGYPRTHRSIQRYCKLGELDCLRQETPFGVQYKITPESVARHIAQIAELASATGRDLSRQDATSRDESRQATTTEISDILPTLTPAITPDEPRQLSTSGDAPVIETERDEEDRYTSQLEKRLDEKDEVIGILKGQLAAKDEQIKEQTERARETNYLIRGLQELVLRLQPGSPPPRQRESSSDQGQ